MAHHGWRERSVAFKLPHATLYIAFPLRAFGCHSSSLMAHLSSWNAERHQLWGENLLYLLLCSSIHRHFSICCRPCALWHIPSKGLNAPVTNIYTGPGRVVVQIKMSQGHIDDVLMIELRDGPIRGPYHIISVTSQSHQHVTSFAIEFVPWHDCCRVSSLMHVDCVISEILLSTISWSFVKFYMKVRFVIFFFYIGQFK